MGLNLTLVSTDIKKYGAPLYALVKELGTFNASEATVIDANTFMSDGYYIRIRQTAIDAGEFVAERDASGDDGPNGPWTVAKGKRVLLAW